MTAGTPAPHTPLVLFSHGNSFPASTYNVMLRSLRARGCHVRAIEKFGHDPQFPVTSNWPHLVEQLADFAKREVSNHAGPVYLVGHSMGGFLSLMCAAMHPVLSGKAISGVVVLDSPLLGGWRARTLQMIKHSQLIGALSPGQVSRKRRNSWASAEEALAHFAHKRVFQRWHPQSLQDYIEHGTHDVTTANGKRRVLSFDRDVETKVYNTLPHNLDRLLRKHPLQCPFAFVGGTQSQEMKTVGMAMTRKLVDKNRPERLQLVEGSHLFPLERPLETAETVVRALRSF